MRRISARPPETIPKVTRNPVKRPFTRYLLGPSIQESEIKLWKPESMIDLDVQELYTEFLLEFEKVSSELFKLSKEFGADWE